MYVAYTCMCVSVQDPPNAELVCKVNGVVTTTAVTITAPALMTGESGAMTLTYDVELLRMTRGGPSVFNTSALVEPVNDEALVCDDGTGVSLFIDDVGGCPSPMTSTINPNLSNIAWYIPVSPGGQLCVASSTQTCASGFTLEESGPPLPSIRICVSSN